MDTSDVIDGAVTDEYVTGQRRSVSLSVEPSAKWLRWARLPGLELRVFSGFSWGRSEHVLPMGRFPVLPPVRSLPKTAVTFTGDDWWSWVTAYEFKPPVAAYAGTMKAVVTSLIVEAELPYYPLVSLSSDADMPTGLVWDKTAAAAIGDAMDVVGGEAFVDRDGVPVVRDRAALQGAPLLDGDGGTVLSASSTEDWADVKNTIVITSSNTDLKFDPVFLEIDDPHHPAHRSKMGRRRVFEYSSPLFTSREQAEFAAPYLLAKRAGPALSWSLSCLSDPAVDAGDVVDVRTDLGAVTARVRKVVHDLSAGAPMAVTLEAL